MGYEAAGNMLPEEPSPSPEECFQTEPHPQPHSFISDAKTDTKQQNKNAAKHSLTIDEQNGSMDLFSASQLHTSLQSSSKLDSAPENAGNLSLELSDMSPSQTEDDSSVIDSEYVDSTTSNGREAAYLQPEQYQSNSAAYTEDSLIGTKANSSSQFHGRSLPSFVDAQNDKNVFVNKMCKIKERMPHTFQVNNLQNHVEFSEKNRVADFAVSTEHMKKVSESRGLVDTTAPFESVREAVSKFGGIVDWKAHKALAVEKRNHMQHQLEKIQGGIPTYKVDLEAAEIAKAEVLQELDNTKRLVEALKLDLERAQIEEAQAKQDAQLARLRAKEMEDGITDESSIAAKAQLEVAKARHEAAMAELKSVKEELSALREQCASLVVQGDVAKRRAKEALSASKDVEREVEGLTLELIMIKESLESSHSVHLEAEELRISAVLARDEDCLHWNKEIMEAQEEMCRLNEQVLQTKDLKANLEGALSLLADIKRELAVYMDFQQMNEEDESKGELFESDGSQLALASMKMELEELQASVEMAKTEVSLLREAKSSLKSELEKEKANLALMKHREEMAFIAVSSLETEIKNTGEEIKQAIEKEKEAREMMVELPKLLQQAAIEADKSKAVAKIAKEEHRKAIEAAEQVKSTFSITEIRLRATLKEIEAVVASESLAIAAVKALQDSENAVSMEDSPRGVTLPLEEYYKLSKKAIDAEELSNEKISSAIAQFREAKAAELESFQRLKEAYEEMDQSKEDLKTAIEKANMAKEEKLGAEQELRMRRLSQSGANPRRSPPKNFDDNCETKMECKEAVFVAADAVHSTLEPNIYTSANKMEHPVPEFKPRKKSFFPHIAMFLARKRTQSGNR